MGTLSSEPGPAVERVAARPRVYADANVPAGVVAHMRQRLGWDVLFVMEHPDLRRARDAEHFRLSHQLRRTLITLDRDYLDGRRFDATRSSGVLVLAAPDQRALTHLLSRLNEAVFGVPGATALPLEGRTLHAHTDWEEGCE